MLFFFFFFRSFSIVEAILEAQFPLIWYIGKYIGYYEVHIYIHVGLDKSWYQVNIFLTSQQNICCGYSLEVPW